MVADIEPLNAMIEQIGLAVAQGAVRQQGGQLWLLHRPGGGLIVRMQVPAVTATQAGAFLSERNDDIVSRRIMSKPPACWKPNTMPS